MNADLGGEDSRWLVAQDGFTAELANTYETLFTVGNRLRLQKYRGRRTRAASRPRCEAWRRCWRWNVSVTR